MDRQVILKSSALLTTSGYLSGFFWYLFFLIAARWLGVEDFGKLTFALTFVAIFRFTMDIGLSQLSQREISRNAVMVDEYFSNIMFFKLMLTSLSLVLVIILINILGYPLLVRRIVYILSFAEGLNSFSDFFRYIFRAKHEMFYEAVIWVSERGMVLVIALAVLNYGGGVLSVAVTLLFTASLKFFAGLTLLLKKFVIKLQRPSFEFLRREVGRALVIGLASVLGFTYFKIDTVMLSLMVGDKSVGLYNACYTILDGMIMLSTSIGGALFTSLSSLYKKDEDRFWSISRTSIKYMLMFSIPIAFFIAISATDIVFLIYGEKYIDGSGSLKVLIWTLILHSILVVASTALFAMGEEKRMIYILFFAVLLNILLNFYFIPIWLEIGASVATIVCEIFVVIAYLYLLSTLRMNIFALWPAFSLTIVASMVSIIHIILMKLLPLFFVAPLIAVLYLFVYLSLNLLSLNDLKALVGLNKIEVS